MAGNFPRERLKQLYEECSGSFDKMAPILEKEFGWTVQEAYIATEHLFRPKENYN